MTLEVKVDDLHFQYQPRVSQDASLVQIVWFQLKPVTSYRADKVKFTDEQTDRQTDRGTDRRTGNDNTIRPERPRVKSASGVSGWY